jgi:protease-4
VEQSITPDRPGRRRAPWLAIFLGLFVVTFVGYAMIVALIAAAKGTAGLGTQLSGDRIGVISITGMITSSSGEPSLLGASVGAGSQRVIQDIRSAAEDETVKAVLLRINSPGGTAAASQEIYEAILAARHGPGKGKPFIASMADVAASGAYYVAAACDRIVAERATLTGSIGVIMDSYDLSGLMEWARVKPAAVKSGRFKDIGTFDRPMTAAEKALLQDLVDSTYRQFLGDVAKGRGIPIEKLRPLADGRIYNGEQAKQVHLIDDLGGFWDAVRMAQEDSGLDPSQKPNLFYYGRGTLLEQLLSAKSALPSPTAGLGLPGWRPGALTPLWFLAPTALPMTAGG